MRVQALKIASAAFLAAVLAGVSLPAGAQVTSEQRLPVKQESAGDIARRDSIAAAERARADSIAAAERARADSIAAAQQAYRDSVDRAAAAYRDSIAAAEKARLDSIARVDSVKASAALAAAAVAAIPVALSRRDFYFGLAGGTSSPTGDWATPYSLGYNITAPFGWQPMNSRFGLRGDIAFDRHGGEFLASGTPIQPVDYPQPIFLTNDVSVQDLSIWSGNLDATFDVLQWGDRRLGGLYLLGGVGMHFIDTREADIYPVTGGQPVQRVENGSTTEFGFNGGAGVSFGVGTSSLFLESRWFSANLSPTDAQWVPLILGIKFF
jgi:hypothetical protein